ncbi:MAG: hypothetical protein EP305_05915 [Bacteroidetes bacterium]|nr:MAG: hypothetical protein EP305_05915 [Bacteroidota bacterium]
MKSTLPSVIWISMLLCSAVSFGQIQLYYNTNTVPSGSVQQSTLALGQNDYLSFEFENTSSIAKNYFIIRNRMTYPTCWTNEYVNWESLETGGYCYPANESISYQTYHSILIQPGERARLEDYYVVDCDSCAYFRYSIYSDENGFEDSLDIEVCSVLSFDEHGAFSFFIYPNPVVNTLVIQGELSGIEFQLMDAKGAQQAVTILSRDASSLHIDMTTPQEGSYFLQGYDASGKMVFNRSVLKRSTL